MSDEPHEELFDTVRAALRHITRDYTPADGAIDAIQFNLRNAERELTALREAAEHAGKMLRHHGFLQYAAELEAVLAKVRR